MSLVRPKGLRRKSDVEGSSRVISDQGEHYVIVLRNCTSTSWVQGGCMSDADAVDVSARTVCERVKKLSMEAQVSSRVTALARPTTVWMGPMSTLGNSQRSAWPSRLANFAAGGPAMAMLFHLMALHH